jgi:hypothetical protein
MIAMILWFLNIRHSFWYVVPHLCLTIVPSHPTVYRLNMWSSWVRGRGTTQVMYTAKLKDGPKGVKKTFSIIFEVFFKWYDGGGENGITSKMIFEVEVSFSYQNINFPFIEETLGAFLSLPLIFCSVSCLGLKGLVVVVVVRLLRTWGF